MFASGLKEPTPATLKRYGLTLQEWLDMAAAQGYTCYICHRAPKGQLVIDHEHVIGWKKYPPEIRKLCVRGLLCFRCNWRFIPKGMTAQFAVRMAQMLMEYGRRRPVLPAIPKKTRKRR